MDVRELPVQVWRKSVVSKFVQGDFYYTNCRRQPSRRKEDKSPSRVIRFGSQRFLVAWAHLLDAKTLSLELREGDKTRHSPLLVDLSAYGASPSIGVNDELICELLQSATVSTKWTDGALQLEVPSPASFQREASDEEDEDEALEARTLSVLGRTLVKVRTLSREYDSDDDEPRRVLIRKKWRKVLRHLMRSMNALKRCVAYKKCKLLVERNKQAVDDASCSSNQSGATEFQDDESSEIESVIPGRIDSSNEVDSDAVYVENRPGLWSRVSTILNLPSHDRRREELDVLEGAVVQVSPRMREVFKMLSRSSRDELLREATHIQTPPRAVIAKEGDQVAHTYLVLAGELEHTLVYETCGDIVLRHLISRSCAEAYDTDKLWQIDVRSTAPSWLMMFPRSVAIDIAKRREKVEREVLESTLMRLGFLTSEGDGPLCTGMKYAARHAVDSLYSIAQRHTFKSKEVVLEQGAPIRNIFVIGSGEFGLRRTIDLQRRQKQGRSLSVELSPRLHALDSFGTSK